MALIRCKCGGTFCSSPDLEGMFCDKCGEFANISLEETGNADLNAIYDPERVKQFRGTPMNEITLGSETKGRVKICIPSFCTKQEAEILINMQLDYLSYLKGEVEKRNLDIYSTRGKKDSD